MEDYEEDIPAGAEARGLTELKHDGKIDLEKMPTRKERLGYDYVEGEANYRGGKSKAWAKTVMCPVCGSNMKLLKGRKTNFGESLVFQCHAQIELGRYCLSVLQVTVGNNFYMRPGDFEGCDVGWEDVARETFRVEEGDEILQSSVEESFDKPAAMPINPWERNVQSRSIWRHFWEGIMESGSITIQDLSDRVKQERPRDAKGKGLFKLNRELETLPRWMHKRTGYVVKQKGNTYLVVGKSRGDYKSFPFSEESYRRQHGMENL